MTLDSQKRILIPNITLDLQRHLTLSFSSESRGTGDVAQWRGARRPQPLREEGRLRPRRAGRQHREGRPVHQGQRGQQIDRHSGTGKAPGLKF